VPFFDFAGSAVFIMRKQALLELVDIVVEDFDGNLWRQSGNVSYFSVLQPNLNNRYKSRGVLDIMPNMSA
jgi:hypothetical protein